MTRFYPVIGRPDTRIYEYLELARIWCSVHGHDFSVREWKTEWDLVGDVVRERLVNPDNWESGYQPHHG
jgi:hypothetical protein